jgi:hypothetical protein
MADDTDERKRKEAIRKLALADLEKDAEKDMRAQDEEEREDCCGYEG